MGNNYPVFDRTARDRMNRLISLSKITEKQKRVKPPPKKKKNAPHDRSLLFCKHREACTSTVAPYLPQGPSVHESHLRVHHSGECSRRIFAAVYWRPGFSSASLFVGALQCGGEVSFTRSHHQSRWPYVRVNKDFEFSSSSSCSSSSSSSSSSFSSSSSSFCFKGQGSCVTGLDDASVRPRHTQTHLHPEN